MILSDWTSCPNCEFPALYSYLQIVVEKTGCCPMCSCELTPNSFQKSANPDRELRGIKDEKGEDIGSNPEIQGKKEGVNELRAASSLHNFSSQTAIAT